MTNPSPKIASAKGTLTVERRFSKADVHPYDELTWEKRDVVQQNWKTKETIFEQRGVEFPTSWSENASTIVTTKYFRGAMGTEARESSLKQLIDRVVNQYVKAAVEHGYMDKATAKVFGEELTWLLANQHFSFNSPVWFNVGTEAPQQVSACFILAVDDSMDSILNWYKEEGFIFKGGSGAGVNISRIRSSKELLSASGGQASGPVSFMRGADASAGTIKSGGATRRAAKMVVLDVDHPDIVEFVETKAKEEDKIRVLRDAGFDMDLGGKDIVSVQYQNANNSVRVTDEFMEAVLADSNFDLKARTDGTAVDTVKARVLFDKIAEAAWACADPGMQYDDTINDWHTNPVSGRITASNPCSEYMSLDNTACNLASLNLMKFVDDNGVFDTDAFVAAVELIFTAMEISIAFGDFPTKAIEKNTRAFRQLGIGYANLGALLMSYGLAYDSEAGRTLAASITSLMTGASYRRSAEIAGVVGAYSGYRKNAAGHQGVMAKHRDAAHHLLDISAGLFTPAGAPSYDPYVNNDVVGRQAEAAEIANRALAEWNDGIEIGEVNGWRNAQASVLAPTGTIGFMMDCDTTGIEPDFSLLKFKKLVGGGSMQIVNGQVTPALERLGYATEQIARIVDFIAEHGNVVGAPDLAESHYDIFDCAAGQPRQITPGGHIKMMAAVQPFLSGAISKTVNLPESATVAEIADIYMESWKLGLKATAVYRDNCKVGQPLSDSKAKPAAVSAATPVEVKVVERIVEKPIRRRPSRQRSATLTSFRVGDADGYLTVGLDDDGNANEMFLKMSKQGSTLAGMMDAFSIAISMGLQHGVPLEMYVAKFINQRFEPAGMTDDPDVRTGQSIIDYVFRRLAIDYLPFEAREAYGIFTTAEKMAAQENGGVYAPVEETMVHQDEVGHDMEVEEAPVAEKVVVVETVNADIKAARQSAMADAPECPTCFSRVTMVRAGSCWTCSADGTSTGCS